MNERKWKELKEENRMYNWQKFIPFQRFNYLFALRERIIPLCLSACIVLLFLSSFYLSFSPFEMLFVLSYFLFALRRPWRPFTFENALAFDALFIPWITLFPFWDWLYLDEVPSIVENICSLFFFSSSTIRRTPVQISQTFFDDFSRFRRVTLGLIGNSNRLIALAVWRNSVEPNKLPEWKLNFDSAILSWESTIA